MSWYLNMKEISLQQKSQNHGSVLVLACDTNHNVR